MISGHCNENGKNKNTNINTQKKTKGLAGPPKKTLHVQHTVFKYILCRCFTRLQRETS